MSWQIKLTIEGDAGFVGKELRRLHSQYNPDLYRDPRFWIGVIVGSWMATIIVFMAMTI
jgi:hypothetical protein